MKKRYFIVYYVGINVKGGYNVGDTQFSTEGEFLNRELTIKQIKEVNPHLSDIVITGIMELNKKDYKNWSKK